MFQNHKLIKLKISLYLIGAVSASAAYAKPSADDTEQIVQLADVVVIGTNRTNVKALESLAPIDTIAAQQLQQTGATTLNQALNQLIPSFNFPQGQNASKGTGSVRSASLRGLSPAYTLILVDGKRRNVAGKLASGVDPFSSDQFVEINTIPISAIERVEVLRDGASAQYGSDAIAGVINIVLKKKATGGDANIRYGQYKEGDGETRSANAWAGFALPNDGFLTLSTELLGSNSADRSGVDHQYVNAGPTGDLRTGRWGQGGRDHASFLLNAETYLTDELGIYSTLNYADIENYNYINPNYSQSKDNILEIYPNGFQPRTFEERRDLSIVSGVKYLSDSLGHFDFSVSYGQSNVENYLSNSLSPSYGLDSKTAFYLGETESQSTNISLDWNKNLDWGWAPKPWTLSAGLTYRHEQYATVEAGEEQSWNNGGELIAVGQLSAGQPARFGSVDISGINPEDLDSISRDVLGLYAGLEGNISQKLEAGAAVRAEHYSDFGDTVNGKLSLRYAFRPAWATRATISTGYRAPSLAQIGQQRTSYTGTWSFDGGQAAAGRTRAFSANDPVVKALGGDELEPAKSTNVSLGIVWQPSVHSSLSIDAYQIEIKDNIVSTSTLQDPADGSSSNVSDILTAAGYSNYTGASFFVNGYDTKTQGIDIIGKYRLELKHYGLLNLSLGLSSFNTEVSNVKQGIIETRTGTTLFNRDVILNLENALPENKINLSAHYQLKKWNIYANLTRYGEYTFNHSTLAARDQTFDPQWVFDLDLKYQLNKHLALNIGANNLFDSYPEKYQSYNQTNGINRYGFIHPAGASGAFYYAGINYRF
jgi:iron complex outermembrane receptor protein